MFKNRVRGPETACRPELDRQSLAGLIDHRVDAVLELFDRAFDVVDSLAGDSTDDVVALVVGAGFELPMILEVDDVFVVDLPGCRLAVGLVVDDRRPTQLGVGEIEVRTILVFDLLVDAGLGFEFRFGLGLRFGI